MSNQVGIVIAQVGIALTGVIAIYLSQSEALARRRYACLFGLAGQPFWLYSALSAEQWGIFTLCLCYTYVWWQGARTHWIRRA